MSVPLIAGGAPAVPSAAAAASTPMVDLGHASSYAVLSSDSVGNTVSAVGAPHTTLRGDLGVVANAQPTGFSPPGVVTGTVNVGNPAAAQARTDLVAAYNQIFARTGGTTIPGALAGATLSPGLYTIGGAASNTTNLTLNGGGDPNAVFVFQINGALAFAAASHVLLTNGAQASRVFWQVNGAGAIGANAGFAGTLIAHDAVAVGNGSLVNGRAFALNGALTLDDDQFYSAAPTVSIAGGASAYTTDTTPTISGTTNVEAPGIVTLTVNGQTLTATPSGGAWTATSAILANGTYPVVASVIDGAGNPGSVTQTLTVDTVPPLVTINGGASATTTNVDPTIVGTSDAAPGTVVTVSIAGQTMTTLVQTSGTWNATPTPVGTGTWQVVASVTDPAGNLGSASQALAIVSATASKPPAATTPPAAIAPPASPHTRAKSFGTSLTVRLPSIAYTDAPGKSMKVHFILSSAAKVTLTLLRGNRVAAKLTTTRRKAGPGSFTWNGKIHGKPASSGTYKVVVQAVSPAGASTRNTATLRIT